MENTGPPFFIVGSARSGTTLLRLMLNAHASVAVPPESRFIPDLYTGRDEVEIEGLLRRLEGHPRFELWDLDIEDIRRELGGRTVARYADVIGAAYASYARRRGKARWGDKTPRYVERIPLLARLWPEARFVHQIRDGRDVALSYARVPFGPKTVTGAARLWSRRVSTGIRFGRALGPERYLEIRYEDFVADVRAASERLCLFIGVDFDPGMLEYTEKARNDMLPRAEAYNPNVTRRPIARTRNWEERMPAGHVEIFEAVAGDLLTELGYPRRFPLPGKPARAAAGLARLGVPVARLTGTGPDNEETLADPEELRDS